MLRVPGRDVYVDASALTLRVETRLQVPCDDHERLSMSLITMHVKNNSIVVSLVENTAVLSLRNKTIRLSVLYIFPCRCCGGKKHRDGKVEDHLELRSTCSASFFLHPEPPVRREYRHPLSQWTSDHTNHTHRVSGYS